MLSKLLNFYLPKIIKKRYVFCWFQRWKTLINSLSSGLTSHLSHLLSKEINPTDIYLFKFNNGNTRKRCEICSKLTIKTPKRRQRRRSGVLLLTAIMFHTFFWCFYCWLWTSKYLLRMVRFMFCYSKIELGNHGEFFWDFFLQASKLALEIWVYNLLIKIYRKWNGL